MSKITKSRPQEDELRTLRLDHIAVDPGLQIREARNPGMVKRYAAAYASGVDMPPLLVAEHGAGWVLLDGYHRHEAMLASGVSETGCRVIRAVRAEWRWIAASANMAHGLPLRKVEIRKVFRAYVGAGQHRQGRGYKSYREMAVDIAGVPHTTIRNWMMKDHPKIANAIGWHEPCRDGGLPEIDHDERTVDQAVMQMGEALARLRTVADPRQKVRVGERLYEMVEELRAAGMYAPGDY